VKKILVIDDEENILQLYSAELKDCGYHVTTASTTVDAIRAIEEERPDLVTLDIRMDNRPDGIDILRKIKDIDSSIPVIINTAYSEYKQNFGVWASEDYVVKSSDLEELKARIASLLEGGQ
jgi:two-component system response regulator (stage 0 sporulation protein F)